MTTQPHTAALLPCPFCGGKALLTEKKHYSLVNCGSIHCDMDAGCKAQRTQDAIAAWNTRAQSQQPATPPAPASQGDSDECAEILSNLIANIEENGLYSEEGMLTFLTQALSCLKPANPAPQQPAQGWQPIDTAPKDGPIWVFNGEQGVMHWTEGECYALWVWTDDVLSDVDPLPDQPTHWMPLPPAPAMTAAQGDAAQGGGKNG